jgi:hypothetical protein
VLYLSDLYDGKKISRVRQLVGQLRPRWNIVLHTNLVGSLYTFCHVLWITLLRHFCITIVNQAFRFRVFQTSFSWNLFIFIPTLLVVMTFVIILSISFILKLIFVILKNNFLKLTHQKKKISVGQTLKVIYNCKLNEIKILYFIILPKAKHYFLQHKTFFLLGFWGFDG